MGTKRDGEAPSRLCTVLRAIGIIVLIVFALDWAEGLGDKVVDVVFHQSTQHT